MVKKKVPFKMCWCTYWTSFYTVQGAVSLTFRELPKTFSRKYTTPEIKFMVRISIWKFVRVPKARLWAHVQSFSLKYSSQVLFVQYTNFERIFWRARETLVKQSPGSHFTNGFAIGIQIRRRICFNVNLLLFIISDQNFAYATTAELWCHEQNFIAITLIPIEWNFHRIWNMMEKSFWNGRLIALLFRDCNTLINCLRSLAKCIRSCSITVTSHECHDVSNKWQLRLFV